MPKPIPNLAERQEFRAVPRAPHWTQELKRSDVVTERHFPSGAWVVSAIIDNHRTQRVYYGYTKAQAECEFFREFPPVA